MKSLDEVGADLSAVYDKVASGEIERQMAETMTNIGGKIISIHKQKFAQEVFLSGKKATLSLPELPDSAARSSFPSAGQLLVAGDKKKAA